ncbi:MAG: biotin/lipoyl-binding protein, partial [Flavobacteriaceae bacterium]|nr:biotin/lipoyl-binding protein [Flavobacteriaceae bacterium]
IVQATKPIYHILENNKALVAEIIHEDFDSKSYTIRVNSNNYTVKIENQLDQLIKELGFSVGNSKKLNDIKAPMPGIIIGIEIKKGDQIKEGDTLLILEAMKMENAILCPKDSTVKSILVKTGDTVEKNKLLIELE